MNLLMLLYLILAAFGCAATGCAPTVEKPGERQRQMYGLMQKFDRFDNDGNGYLTREELEKGLKEAGTLHLSSAQLDKAMKSYDTDGDKRISLREAQLGAARGPKIFDAR